MQKRIAFLSLWAVVATLAFIWLALSAEPVAEREPVEPAPEPARTERLRPSRPRHSDSLDMVLSYVLEPPAPAAAGDPPLAKRIRDLLDSERELEDGSDWTIDQAREIRKQILSLVAHEPEAHLAMVSMLRGADEDLAHSILSYLIWNPISRMVRHGDITKAIEEQATEMIANGSTEAERDAAVRVLFRYGRGSRSAVDYGLSRLDAEPSALVRDALLEEITVAGPTLGLTRREAEPIIDRLWARLDEGEGWCGEAIGRWSNDAEDFRRLRERLATERDPRNRQELVNAFSGDTMITRDRSAEARTVLVGVLTDPTEDAGVRSLARIFLGTTFGPLDPESADAVRRYDAE